MVCRGRLWGIGCDAFWVIGLTLWVDAGILCFADYGLVHLMVGFAWFCAGLGLWGVLC